ncbi:hypothetical protein E8D34_06390 [Nocardioides sp. GY 10113]|uniref:LpqB family beta-propeller domain-containing protein n=1 Tax=Nocardioides sp. GY 10113 TaxID=2569761 RepID=UPI0010A75260|nr:LpqB family beta-propeller domain-containing protein [Nocardioides sp. GY 10113]TIC87920.1 hypothetical protein E8D34_06390 [Nocardioides sp. GY 10113]
MTAPRRPAPRTLALPVVLLAALVLSGCVGLPDRGPVVTREASTSDGRRTASDIAARPPVRGSSPTEIVSGFLDAMTAWPIQTSVAKEYLSDEAAASWGPERSMIVYGDFQPPQETASALEVQVELTDADRLDASGAWRGAMSQQDRLLTFPMTIADGEFRIAEAPDALIVPVSWFQQRFRQVSLYYFDPTGRTLVPEPVFVPAGEQLATSLVSALVEGPARRLRGVVRTYVPEDVSVNLSVPVSDSGIAEVSLSGQGDPGSPEQTELLVAQLAWTLRQDPEITAFRIRIGDHEVRLADGESLYQVDSGSEFDPNGPATSGLLYGLSAGRVVRGTPGDLAPVDGPFGEDTAELRSVAVVPQGEQAAAVTPDGRTALVAAIRPLPDQADEGEAVEHTRSHVVLDGATDLGRPTWDYVGRLWLLDRTSNGAVVWCVTGGRARQVDVPGVTGSDARILQVSRDGTRLVAVVGSDRGDAVVGARIAIGAGGRVSRALAPYTLDPAAPGRRVLDVTWSTPTRLGVITPARPSGLFEVDLLSVDGAAIGVDGVSTIVSGRVLSLAGPGTSRLPTYAVLRESLVDVRTRESVQIGTAVSQLHYVG